MTIDGQDYLTVAEAAEQADVTQQAIRNAIYEKTLDAERMLGRLLIPRGKFEEYLKVKRPVGRPKNTAPGGADIMTGDREEYRTDGSSDQ